MKYLFISLILLCTSTASAQYLSFDQLISLQSKDLEYINEFLTQKKWSFTGSTPETEEKYGKAGWAWYSDFDNNRAYAWFNISYSEGFETRIFYQVFNKVEYTKIKARISALGMNRIESKIEDNTISSTYVGKNYAVGIFSATTDDIATAYSINIYRKDDYYNYLLNKSETADNEDDLDIQYFVQLSEDNKDAGNLWSSSNMGNAELIYKVPSTSQMGVLKEGEVFYEVVVDGYRGFISSYKVKRISNK